MSEAKRPVSVLKLIVLLNLIGVCLTVTAGKASKPHNNLDQFNYCLRQAPNPGLRECVGRTAINFIQRFDERDNYTLLDDFISTKDDKVAARSLVNFLDTDPVDFRGILENAGAVFSQRSLEWHMDALYPGLMLKIGPTANANSVMEFVLDPTVDERNYGGFEEPSTARILAKQYLVPFLLGLKFNLVALVPLFFAFICLLLKKALFFAKLAIYVSSLLGVGGAVSALSAGTLGGLGGLGGFGGFGGLSNGFLPPVRGHAHALDNAAGGDAVNGYFPGKTSVFNHYTEPDEFHHSSPYKRNERSERKLHFNKPREYVAQTASASTPAADRFYDYEKQILLQERSGKTRSLNGKLGPSAYDDEEDETNSSFKPSSATTGGWKVLDLRV